MYNKYQYYQFTDNQNRKVVVAVTNIAGHRVKGYAKCSPEDTFDLETGKKIAAARCNVKALKKIANYLGDRAEDFTDAAEVAQRQARKALDKFKAAVDDVNEAQAYLDSVLSET